MLLHKICIFSNCEIRMVCLFVLQSGSGVNSLILLSYSVTGTTHMYIYVMCFNIQINLVIGKYILKMRKVA